MGQGLEWYDFYLYLYLSVIFAKLYFPTLSANNSLIAVSIGFTLTFSARIVGAYVYGRYGDTKGRARAMVNSMVCLGISALCLTFLPTYNTIGWLAPLGLFLIRAFQGFSIAGEFAGSTVYLNEMSTTTNRTTYFCYFLAVSILGQFSAVGMFTLLSHTLSSSALYQWGWRLLYLIAASLSVILYGFRKQLIETQSFIAVKQKNENETHFSSLIKTNRRPFIICFFLYAFSNIGYIIAGPFPAFLHHLFHIKLKHSYSILTMGNLISFLLLIILAYGAKRFIPKTIFKLNSLKLFLLLMGIVFLISMLTTHLTPFISFSLSTMSFMIISPLSCIVSLIYIPNQFPTRIRYTATALVLNINAFIFGGLAPLFSSLLMKFTGNIISLYALCLAFIVISIIPLAFVKK